MRRGVPTGSPVCGHGYQLSGRGMHPDGVPCLPADVTEEKDVGRLVEAILTAPDSVRMDAPTLDSHALAAHLLRAGYRFVDPVGKHVIDIRVSGSFTIKHPLLCRAGELFDCEVNTAASNLSHAPGGPGVYECTVEAGHFVLLDRVQ